MEEQFSGDQGIGFEAGLAYKGVDLLHGFESLALVQQTQLFGDVHFRASLQKARDKSTFLVFSYMFKTKSFPQINRQKEKINIL